MDELFGDKTFYRVLKPTPNADHCQRMKHLEISVNLRLRQSRVAVNLGGFRLRQFLALNSSKRTKQGGCLEPISKLL